MLTIPRPVKLSTSSVATDATRQALDALDKARRAGENGDSNGRSRRNARMTSKSQRVTSRIRYWDETKQAGLAVADIPAKSVDQLGGRRQMRVKGTLNGKPFTGATMLVQGGGFCVGVTKDVMRTAGVAIGDKITLVLEPAAKG